MQGQRKKKKFNENWKIDETMSSIAKAEDVTMANSKRKLYKKKYGMERACEEVSKDCKGAQKNFEGAAEEGKGGGRRKRFANRRGSEGHIKKVCECKVKNGTYERVERDEVANRGPRGRAGGRSNAIGGVHCVGPLDTLFRIKERSATMARTRKNGNGTKGGRETTRRTRARGRTPG